jgi:hypothetical protein
MNELEQPEEMEAEVSLMPPSEIGGDNLPAARQSGVVEYRKQLVKEYHKGAPSLMQRLKEQGTLRLFQLRELSCLRRR